MRLYRMFMILFYAYHLICIQEQLTYPSISNVAGKQFEDTHTHLPPSKYSMIDENIHISLSKSYASGFINVNVTLNEFASLQGCRLFHAYDERMVKIYVETFYRENSDCFQWLCLLNYHNQFTGDLLARKCLRPYLTFQYIFFDIKPSKSIKQLISEIKSKPNVISISRNEAVRLFYILIEPRPLTEYTVVYGHFLPFVAPLGLVLDNSSPKAIRADRGAVINRELHSSGFINELY